jgi:hypothetical protein
LTFTPGQTSQTFSVPVLGDTLVESNEVFQVLLFSPTNAGISDDQGLGTITNDDGAPPSRVFVSDTGNDANICSTQTTPCRNIAGAIGQVEIGGEVIILSPGEYDTAPILIGKSVKVTSPSGTVAFVRQRITVNAPSGRVTLRGLTLKGGAGSAVNLLSADALSIEETTFDGWNRGLDLANTDASAISVTNSTFASTTTAVNDQGNAANRVAIADTRFEKNATGLFVSGATVTIRAGAFNSNTTGITCTGGFVNVNRSEFWENTTAIETTFSGTARVSRSHVFGNNTGFASGGLSFQSAGTNVVRGNVTNTTGTITAITEQ